MLNYKHPKQQSCNALGNSLRKKFCCEIIYLLFTNGLLWLMISSSRILLKHEFSLAKMFHMNKHVGFFFKWQADFGLCLGLSSSVFCISKFLQCVILHMSIPWNKPHVTCASFYLSNKKGFLKRLNWPFCIIPYTLLPLYSGYMLDNYTH